MANVTIDIDVLTESLRKASIGALPWVKLQAVKNTLHEPTPPSYLTNASPVVMVDPVLIPDPAYIWTYKNTRQVVLEYVLQRNTDWQTGRIRLFHTMPIDYLNSLDEPTPPPIPSPYTAHQLYFSHTIDLTVGNSCGVTLSALHDPSSTGVEERFGIGFQITSASPSQFPLFAASYVSVIPLT